VRSWRCTVVSPFDVYTCVSDANRRRRTRARNSVAPNVCIRCKVLARSIYIDIHIRTHTHTHAHAHTWYIYIIAHITAAVVACIIRLQRYISVARYSFVALYSNEAELTAHKDPDQVGTHAGYSVGTHMGYPALIHLTQ
jgi:hypothetical protein